MTTDIAVVVAVSVVTFAALIGLFKTKSPGFGKFTTSLLLLILVLFFASVFLAVGKVDGAQFTNVLFAVAGFGGGLISAKE